MTTRQRPTAAVSVRAYLADLRFRLIPFTVMRHSTLYAKEHNAFTLGLDAGRAGYRPLSDGRFTR